MLDKDLNTKSTRTELRRVSLENLIQLEVPDSAVKQIRFLCKEIPDQEWSGVLFYSVEGSIRNFETLKLKVEYILPMQKGTATETEFEHNEEVTEFMMDNPQAMQWKMGLVHSHNRMRTFFSGQDWSELEQNSPVHNYYLSLIVNNFMELTAKIAFIGEVQNYLCKDEKGAKYNFNLEDKEKVMFTFDADIVFETSVQSVDKDFEGRVSSIIQIAEEKDREREREMAKRLPINGSNGTGGYGGKSSPPWTKVDDFFKKKEEEFAFREDAITNFTGYVIRMGDSKASQETLDNSLEDLKQSDSSHFNFVSAILEKYPDYYDKYWDEKEHNIEAFMEITEGVIENLEEYDYEYNFITQIITGLQLMLDKMEPTKV